MISMHDCIALCGLSEEEVLAIAEHEHIPEIAAAALAQYLLQREHGPERIRDMIVDDIRQAQARASPRPGKGRPARRRCRWASAAISRLRRST